MMTFKMRIGFAVLAALLMAAAPAHAEKTSIAQLMGLGNSVACSYQKTDENGNPQSGTFYLSGQKMRGEIQVTAPDGTYPMNMLREGEWQYMWGGPLGDTRGMKINTATPRSGRSPHGQHGPDVNEEVDYQCKPWTVDASKFEVPQNVEFMDMAQMMPTGMMQAAMSQMGEGGSGSGMDMHAMHCAACNQAPAEQQEQCRQAMGC